MMVALLAPLKPSLVESEGGMMEHSVRVTGFSLSSPIVTVIVVELTLIVPASIATVSDVSF